MEIEVTTMGKADDGPDLGVKSVERYQTDIDRLSDFVVSKELFESL